MLKFQDNYSIQIENMEDLILISYVMIDELYKQYAPQKVTKRKNVSKVKLSDSGSGSSSPSAQSIPTSSVPDLMILPDEVTVSVNHA